MFIFDLFFVSIFIMINMPLTIIMMYYHLKIQKCLGILIALQ